MGRDDDSPDNFFIRFKHRVDANVSTAIKSVRGDPPANITSAPDDIRPDPTSSDLVTPSASSNSRKTMEPFAIDVTPFDRNMASAAVSSHYSPLTLRHLRQPVPSDAPSNLDTSIFTFEDAFEDLLAVSQGQKLPDISTRHDQRKLLRSMFPTGEPADFWLRRLSSQGLLELPGPGQIFGVVTGPNWDFFHEELDRRAADVWRMAADRRRAHEDGDDVYSAGFREAGADNGDKQLGRPSGSRREPDNFDEFFSSFRSSFADKDNSWDSFVKTIADERQGSKEKVQPAQDNKQVVEKEDYVDSFGFRHSKVKYKILDDEGNEVGTSTHHSISSSSDESEKPEGQGTDDDEQDRRKKSWFWK